MNINIGPDTVALAGSIAGGLGVLARTVGYYGAAIVRVVTEFKGEIAGLSDRVERLEGVVADAVTVPVKARAHREGVAL